MQEKTKNKILEEEKDWLRVQVKENHEMAVKHRRYLHMHPEIGFDTENTEKYIKKFLQTEQIEIIPTKTGVVGRIPGKSSERVVALRADMDALCLQEKNEVEYKSLFPNKMHACGHDGHTTMLMMAAKILNSGKERLPNDVLLIFQPAEEGPRLGGARLMLAELTESQLAQKIDQIYALHLTAEFDAGQVGIRYGSAMSSTDDFDIEIIGKGGHAGLPHKTIDAVSIAAKFVGEMESFMSRKLDPFDPAVFSVGVLNAGSARNVVSENASLSGTIRCQSEYNREFIVKETERILQGICEYTGATYQLRIQRGLPVLGNDTAATDYAKEIAEELLGTENVILVEQSNMGAEDFAYFAQKIPACFLWVGGRNTEKGFVHLMHDPRFDFDETALDIGIKQLCAMALCYGQKEKR